MGGTLDFVGAATFDAFATQLLASEEPIESWIDAGYDQRIGRATDLLRGPATLQSLAIVRHVLVDEIQDLVGPRAELVMALLLRLRSGFTLFGDPAQAIYGHQLDSPDTSPTNPEFYRWLTETFRGTLSKWLLMHDFRGHTAQAEAIKNIGLQLRGTDPIQVAIASELRTLLLSLPTITLGAARRVLTRADLTTSALLCRTNAEALRISQELFERDIAHRYQRRGEDKAASGWLGRAVAGITETRTTRSMLMPSLEQAAKECDSSADELFAVVRRLDPARGDTVDLQRIANRLREGSFPEELNEVVRSQTVVSTIHRAKGLEFDSVLLCDASRDDATDLGEANRLHYVALTRARTEIFHCSRPETEGLRRDRGSGRWVRRGWGPNSWKLYELELAGSDSDAVHPAGTWYFQDDVRELQDYLARAVAPGDPVKVEMAPTPPGEHEVPHLVIRHNSRLVGVTSDAFGSFLVRVLGSRARLLRSISGLHVEMVDTVAGDATLAGATASAHTAYGEEFGSLVSAHWNSTGMKKRGIEACSTTITTFDERSWTR